MTGHDLKIWLVTNNYTQKTLSQALGVTERTIGRHANGTPPKWLVLALKGLEL